MNDLDKKSRNCKLRVLLLITVDNVHVLYVKSSCELTVHLIHDLYHSRVPF